MRIVPGTEALILAAPGLFDDPPTPEFTARFLAQPGHHILMAVEADDEPVGFVSGVEVTHPDKGTEMLLYELSVREDHRRQGFGRALVDALAELARDRGCYGMWVGTEPDNEAAIATYRDAEREDFVGFTWTFARAT